LGAEVTADQLPKEQIESNEATEPTATIKGNDVTIDDEVLENGQRNSHKRDARSKALRERHSTLKSPPPPAPADPLVPEAALRPVARLLPATVPVSATTPATPSVQYEAVQASELTRNVDRARDDDHMDWTDEKSLNEGEESAPPIPLGEHTWEELEAIEKRRRAILLRGEYNVWKTLCSVDGTVLKFLLEDSLFWITVLLYITVRLLARYSQIPEFVAGLGDGNLTTIGGFITFFLALYVNNSHARYFDQYDAAMACKGRILDVASLAATYLPKTTAHRIVRYMNAAHVSGYVGLSSTYSYPNFFVKINKDFRLLSALELERMNAIDLDKGGSCNRELIVWCLREIQFCHAQGIIDHELSREFRDHILRLRAALGTIYDAADLPIPFFYVHFISLLTALYLPLFAVSAAYKVGTGTGVFWFGDILVLLVVVLQAIFVNGLRLLGQKMSDPFGDDLTDLSVIFYVTFTWTMSNRILESGFVDTGETDENRLRRLQMSLGDAWEPRKEKV
jgi:predicted membrane chloride channel (bestrophin family)